MTKEQLDAFAKLKTDRGGEQLESYHDAIKQTRQDMREMRCATSTVNFELLPIDGVAQTPTALDDIVLIRRIRENAQILWHETTIVADDDAASVEGEVGYIDEETQTFVPQATLANGDTALTDVSPEPDKEPLKDDVWIALKLKGTPPTLGKASFFIKYVSLS